MSPRRFLVEFLVVIVAASGACIGYSAGSTYGPSAQLIFAFIGMSLGGAFTDFCLRGGH
jgi:hypothetical protein